MEQIHCFLQFLASKHCLGHFWAPPFMNEGDGARHCSRFAPPAFGYRAGTDGVAIEALKAVEPPSSVAPRYRRGPCAVLRAFCIKAAVCTSLMFQGVCI